MAGNSVYWFAMVGMLANRTPSGAYSRKRNYAMSTDGFDIKGICSPLSYQGMVCHCRTYPLDVLSGCGHDIIFFRLYAPDGCVFPALYYVTNKFSMAFIFIMCIVEYLDEQSWIAYKYSDMTISSVSNKTLLKTMKYRDFKEAGTKGIAECKIRSIILPLLADHVLREANQYIRLLKQL